MSKQTAPRSIVSIFAVLAIFLAYAWSVNLAHAEKIGSQLSIAANGQSIIRDATVRAIAGNTVTIETTWDGGMTMDWIVETSGSTEFYPREESKALLSAVKIGDRVNVTGMLLGGAPQSHILASTLRDSSLEDDGARVGGIVSLLDAAHGTFTLEGDDGPKMIVRVGRGTVITRGGDPIALADIAIGERVSVFGTLNLVTHIITAGKITSVSDLPSGTRTPTQVGESGFFAKLFAWLRGRGGEVTIK